MRFKKIKILSTGVNIEWETKVKDADGNSDWASHSISSPDEPIEEFRESINSLKPYLISIAELKKLDARVIHCTGISLSYKGEDNEMSVQIHGYRTFANSKGSDPINAPKKAAKESGQPTASENHIPEECLKIVETIFEQAKLYIKGERIQQEMDLEEEEGEEKEETEGQED